MKRPNKKVTKKKEPSPESCHEHHDPCDQVEQAIDNMKPDKTMEQMSEIANQKLNSMNKNEVEQHHRIDMKYRDLEEY